MSHMLLSKETHMTKEEHMTKEMHVKKGEAMKRRRSCVFMCCFSKGGAMKKEEHLTNLASPAHNSFLYEKICRQ